MWVESDDIGRANELQPKTQWDKGHSCFALVLNKEGEECCLIYHGCNSNAIWAHWIQNPFHVHWYFWYAQQNETLGFQRKLWNSNAILKQRHRFQCFNFVVENFLFDIRFIRDIDNLQNWLKKQWKRNINRETTYGLWLLLRTNAYIICVVTKNLATNMKYILYSIEYVQINHLCITVLRSLVVTAAQVG